MRNPPPISTRYCTAAVLIVLYNCIVLSRYNTTQVQAFSSGDPSHLSGTSTLIILVQRECHANDVPNNIGVLHTYIPRMLLWWVNMYCLIMDTLPNTTRTEITVCFRV